MTAVDLDQLAGELSRAGIPVPRGLGTRDGTRETVHTYDGNGTAVPLPAGAGPIILAHVVPPPPPPPNYGADADDLDTGAAQAATQLRQFLALASPTNAQIVANARLQNRAILALMKRVLA